MERIISMEVANDVNDTNCYINQPLDEMLTGLEQRGPLQVVVRLHAGAEEAFNEDEDVVLKDIDEILIEIESEKGKLEEKYAEELHVEPPLTTFKLIFFIIQRCIFFIIWMILTYFLLTTEHDSFLATAVSIPANGSRDSAITSYTGSENLGVSLTGPFKIDYGHHTEQTMQLRVLITLTNTSNVTNSINYYAISDIWILNLIDDPNYMVIISDEHLFQLKKNIPISDENDITLSFRNDLNRTITIKYRIDLAPLDKKKGIIFGVLVLLFLYILIVFDIINRTFASMLVSTLAVSILAALGMRPTVQTLVSWIDVETILLLFGMMIIVGILSESGFIDYMTVFAYEVTKGRIWPLINLLCFFTAAFSTFMDSVTMMLLVTPVTIRLCEVTELNPVPILMCMIFFSNVGGANIIITTNQYISSTGMNFITFLTHMLPAVVLAIIQTYSQLRYIYRDMTNLRLNKPLKEEVLRHEMDAWKRAADIIHPISKEENIVHDTFLKKVNKLKNKLSKGLSASTTETPQNFDDVLKQMRATYFIRDKILLIKSLISFGLAAVLFCVHSIPIVHNLTLGWAAMSSAILLMVIADVKHVVALVRRVEWSTLIFLASLFILMEALAKMGLIKLIGDWVKIVILKVQPKDRLICAILIILWVSAIASAFLDIIPVATMMLKIVIQLAKKTRIWICHYIRFLGHWRLEFALVLMEL